MKQNNISMWLYMKNALELAKKFPKGPHSRSALKWAGKKFNFIRKAKDGFHWEINRKDLMCYCSISSNKFTVREIAGKLDTTMSKIYYIIMKNGIKFKKKMGRRYLEKEDETRIIKLYKEVYNERKK